MSKRLVHEMAYDAPAEKVLAMLADPAFREEVCDYQRVLRREVTATETADGFEVTIDQYQAAQGIPSFDKKFVGDEINIVQTESWHGPTGDVTVTIFWTVCLSLSILSLTNNRRDSPRFFRLDKN